MNYFPLKGKKLPQNQLRSIYSRLELQKKKKNFTDDDDEREQELWVRKQRAKYNPATAESIITLETMTTNYDNTDITIKSRLSKTNPIATEQTNNGNLVHFEAKIQKEDYSDEEVLQQDAIYTYYIKNTARIVLRDEVLTRQYFDETGQTKCYQILLPQHLVAELLDSLHGEVHKHPGIAKMLQEL